MAGDNAGIRSDFIRFDVPGLNMERHRRPGGRTDLSACRLLIPLTVLFSAHASLAAEQGGRWADQRVAGPFVCRADFPLDEHLGLLRELEPLQRELTRILGVPSAREPIHLYLFEKKKTYQSFIKHHFPGVPYRRAVYVKARGPGIVLAYLHSGLATDVRHEGTHALLHAALPMVPLWLDEGLAEYFEVAPKERARGNSHLTSVRWAARFGIVPKLDELEQFDGIDDMDSSDYRHAWAWVHFMFHGSREGHAELVRYLEDIRNAVPPGQLSDRLRRRLPDVERHFIEHFRSWKP